jgi:hypothetical protein
VEQIQKQKDEEQKKASEEFLKRQVELERNAEEKITRLQVLRLQTNTSRAKSLFRRKKTTSLQI